MAPLFAPSASRRCDAMADSLVRNGNAAIGAKSKPDIIDFPVTGH